MVSNWRASADRELFEADVESRVYAVGGARRSARVWDGKMAWCCPEGLVMWPRSGGCSSLAAVMRLQGVHVRSLRMV